MHETRLLRLIAERFDPDTIVDMLNLSSQELVLVFMDEILKNKELFLEYVDFEEFKNEY